MKATPPTETYGNYTLLKRLATGGMAEIFLARQIGLEGFENLLVLKRLLPHLAADVEFVRMFLDEARIAARLMHPNIVQVFNLGAQGESYFIAMEYVHGEDLNQVWRHADQTDRPLPVALACRIILEAARGLDYAHKRTYQNGKPLKVVHRDVSPQNILLSFQGDVKVADFGIARASDQSTNTRSGVLKGKRSYMSPEQASGMRVDARSDIFSLGVVLYELLTSSRLFKRQNAMQTLHAVIACEVSAPSSVNGRVPADLDALVLKALAKRPEDRYAEAGQLADALEGWLRGQKAPSDAEALSLFLAELYKDRLSAEGRSEPSKPKSASAPPAKRAVPAPARKPTQNVPAALPASPPPSPVHTVSLMPPSKVRGPPRRSGLWKGLQHRAAGLGLGVGAALAVVALTAWFLSRPAAELQLDSEPPGARVAIDGRLREEVTPCVVKGLPAGVHALSLSKAGFREHREPVTLPARGAVALPRISLLREHQGQVSLTLRTQPAHAQVLVGGVVRGRSPLTVEVPPLAPVQVAFELNGYRTLKLALEIGEGPSQELSISLERLPGLGTP